MAAKRRHWHEKDGRFWARIATPEDLKLFFGKTQLTEALGGDLRAADRTHAGAVARLQDQIREARAKLVRTQDFSPPKVILTAFTREHAEQAIWDHYTQVLGKDEAKRTAMPTPPEVESEHERLFQRVKAGEVEHSLIAQINASTDLELMINARAHDANVRVRRLAALRASMQTGDMRLLDAAVQLFAERNELVLVKGSREWHEVAQMFARAEIEAIQRTIEMDHGDFGGKPSDPVVRPPAQPAITAPPMRLATDEFIRRFLIHVLPDGLHRIRHYGLLASATRKANIAKVRAMLGAMPPQADPQTEVAVAPLTMREPCPCCGGPMRIVEIFRHGQKPRSRAPPREQAAR